MLLLDVLINFSPLYIPDTIGGRMDLPLLINMIVYRDEVDEQAHSVDTCWTYQLQYYEVSMKGAKASEIPPSLKDIEIRPQGWNWWEGCRLHPCPELPHSNRGHATSYSSRYSRPSSFSLTKNWNVSESPSVTGVVCIGPISCLNAVSSKSAGRGRGVGS